MIDNRTIFNRMAARRHAALCNFSRRYTKTFSRKPRPEGMPIDFANLYVPGNLEDFKNNYAGEYANFIAGLTNARDATTLHSPAFKTDERLPDSNMSLNDINDELTQGNADILKGLSAKDAKALLEAYHKSNTGIPVPLENYTHQFLDTSGNKTLAELRKKIDPRGYGYTSALDVIRHGAEYKNLSGPVQKLIDQNADALTKQKSPYFPGGELRTRATLEDALRRGTLTPQQLKDWEDAVTEYNSENHKTRAQRRGAVEVPNNLVEKNGNIIPGTSGGDRGLLLRTISGGTPDLAAQADKMDPTIVKKAKNSYDAKELREYLNEEFIPGAYKTR